MVFQAVTASAERMFVKKKNSNTKYMFYHCYLAINSFHFKYIFLLLLFKTHDKNTRVLASQCVCDVNSFAAKYLQVSIQIMNKKSNRWRKTHDCFIVLFAMLNG